MNIHPHHSTTTPAPAVDVGTPSFRSRPGADHPLDPDPPIAAAPRRRVRAASVLVLAVASLFVLGATPASAAVRAGEDVFEFGATAFHGSAETASTDSVVDVASTSTGKGYWLLSEDGGVFSYGDAVFHGSAAERPLNSPLVGLAPHPGGQGYWVVGSDGGVFAFGPPFLGSMAGTRLSQPVVGMAATTTGKGYWLVSSDGGIFSFGDARFMGSMSGRHLNQPIVGMAADPDGGGYWLVGADGAVFSFNAQFFGSATDTLSSGDQAVGIAASSDGGYWVASRRGGVFSFGAAPFAGAGTDGNRPIVGIAANPNGEGYWLAAGPPPPPPPPAPVVRTASAAGAGFAALRACESGGNYGAISPGGAYRGAYQFSQSTWNGVAARWNPSLVGVDPARASAAAQDSMAAALFSERGRSPWPICGRLV